ncbi:MAG: DNA-processing protein DprA [Rhodothermales bacterium]
MYARTRRPAAGDRDEERALIALSLVPGVGIGRIRLLLAAFGSARAVLSTPRSVLSGVPGIGSRTAERIARFDDLSTVDRQFERARRVGAEFISMWDDRYPYLLRKIYDPPPFIWVRGRMPVADGAERALAIVGTRRASAYGRRTTHDISHILVRLGFTIVSGLAYGIDVASHAAALEAGGRTIAVLGSGVDRVYPARHRRLTEDIVHRGAVISEFPMGAKPEAQNFPRRNRVVSGLCLGTIVVEAREDGGALITARLALQQNREVFAVPGPIHSPASAGTNRLIQGGEAKLVQTVEDILDELGMRADAEDLSLPTIDVASLSPEEQALCKVLSPEPMHIDALCGAAGLEPAVALVHLLNLEFKGVVHQQAGKHFYLSASINP